MLVVTNAPEYEGLHHQWGNRKIALVPTMGALHEGHAALIRHARALADVVVVSIFVNPLQFGPTEDLGRYPRPFEQDLKICRDLGVDVVFHPTVETMYPEGLENVTTVTPPASLTDCLCGAYRPGHFTGVATIVLKLFHLIRPYWAVFGEKDAQQLAVIRKMVRDLQVPVEIVPHPTMRDGNGLALSSRNRYLGTDEEKQAALSLFRLLKRIRERAKALGQQAGTQAVFSESMADVLSDLGALASLLKIQYLQAVDPVTLEPVETLKPGVKVLIAAYINDVRLIDNMDID